MFRKVQAKERIVGFYSSGPKIKQNDLAIEGLIRKFVPNPVFVVIDVRPNQEEIPTTAYKAIEARLDAELAPLISRENGWSAAPRRIPASI